MRIAFLAILVASAATAPASLSAQPITDDIKVNQLIVYGTDACPVSSDEEITVCARRPEGERFRIPEPLRDNPNDPANDSWVNRAEALEYHGRSGIGSCTPIGPGGGIGCFQQLVRQARAERNASDEVNWTRLVEDARQDRLDRIDAEAEKVQRQIDERDD